MRSCISVSITSAAMFILFPLNVLLETGVKDQTGMRLYRVQVPFDFPPITSCGRAMLPEVGVRELQWLTVRNE